jgi:hypothetical protein
VKVFLEELHWNCGLALCILLRTNTEQKGEEGGVAGWSIWDFHFLLPLTSVPLVLKVIRVGEQKNSVNESLGPYYGD